MSRLMRLPAMVVVLTLGAGACGTGEDERVAGASEAVGVAEVAPPTPAPSAPPTALGADAGNPAADISTAACSLVSDDEAGGILGVPLSGPGRPAQQAVLGSSTCTWSGTVPEDDNDRRTLQVTVSRTGWISESIVGERTAQLYYNQDKAALGVPDVAVPADLGIDAYVSDRGLCVLESEDLAWCVAATGTTALTRDDPALVDRMRQTAELVNARIG